LTIFVAAALAMALAGVAVATPGSGIVSATILARAGSGRTYSAGQAFIDSGQGHVHLGRNLSSTQNAEVWVTYFDVPVGGGVRVDAADPGNCAF
jgi:hypothetical protein